MEQTSEDQQFQNFINFHGIQLYAVKFPRELERKLYQKLKEETFDIGWKVQIIVNQEEEKVDLVVASDKTITTNEDVFLIDHAWSFRYREAEPTLRSNDKLLERMLNIVRYSEKLELPSNPYSKARPQLEEYLQTISPETKALDLDNYGITSLDGILLPESLEEISLFNNEIENPNEVAKYLTTLPNLRALWLNNNPVVDMCVNFNHIGEHMPCLEILNSKFTSKAGEWSLLYYAKDQQVSDISKIRKLDLSGKGVLTIQDLSFFDRMTSLKTLDISDHPDFFQTEEQRQEEEKKQREGAAVVDKDSIEFVQKNHTIDELLSKLTYVQSLTCDEDLEEYILQNRSEIGFLPRLQEINKISIKMTIKEEREKEKKIRKVMDKIWMYLGSYRLVTTDKMDEECVWYVMDEVGSAMKHSDQPNLAVHPFIYSPNNEIEDPHHITYSICWPLSNANSNDILYRDFLSGIDETKFRSARFAVWFNTPEEYFAEQIKTFRSIQPKTDPYVFHNAIQEKFAPMPAIDVGMTPDATFKVCTDYEFIQQYLTHPRFKVVIDDPSGADIVWCIGDFYNVMQPQLKLDMSKKYVNQFEYEGSYVMKHHLANLIQSTLKDQNVIMETYILNDFLPSFIGRYIEREKLALDNSWILKPVNMARSMDTWVTTNLDEIIRMVETGPKIAQKYIYNPCTYLGKKFDLRFVVLLKSVLPLELYCYNEFYSRFSNNEFEMNESSFSNYETHFTVMNYRSDVKLTNVRYFDFEKSFDEQYAGRMKWAEVQRRIHESIKQIFIAFQVKHGEDLDKLGNHMRSRSMYGIDVMVTDEFEPKILEVTFSPDCKRACLFNPDFFNDVFSCLFLNDAKNVIKL